MNWRKKKITKTKIAHMAKDDPAFLFYPKEWLSRTAEMLPDEKGVFIDLLAYQHQLGSLPTDTKRLAKLVRLSESEFLPIWQTLQPKFKQMDDRLVNRMLNELMTERSEKGWRNRITGTLASVVRLSKVPREIKEKIKNSFKIEEFLDCPEHLLTERLTEWYQYRLKSIGNADINTDEDNSKIEGKDKGDIGGSGEKEGKGEEERKEEAEGGSYASAYQQMIVPSMLTLWKKYNPKYTIDRTKDCPALFKIAEFICDQDGISKNAITNSKKHVLEVFEVLCPFIMSDSWFKNYNLAQVEKYIQNISSKYNNGATKQPTGGNVSTQSAFDKIDLYYSKNGTTTS